MLSVQIYFFLFGVACPWASAIWRIGKNKRVVKDAAANHYPIQLIFFGKFFSLLAAGNTAVANDFGSRAEGIPHFPGLPNQIPIGWDFRKLLSRPAMNT